MEILTYKQGWDAYAAGRSIEECETPAARSGWLAANQIDAICATIDYLHATGQSARVAAFLDEVTGGSCAELRKELKHLQEERDAADRACARLEREVEELRQQLAQADAENAELILRLRKLQEKPHE